MEKYILKSSLETVLHSPAFGAVGHDFEIQTPAIGQFIRLLLGF